MALNTVMKCGTVLDLFTLDRPEWGVSGIAKALAIPKSSAHALAASLAGIGLLQRTPKGQYHLGWRICSMSAMLIKTTEARDVAHDAIAGLVRQFGETAHFGVLYERQVVFLDKVGGSRSIAVPDTDMGDHKPAAKIAVGKALLACRPREEVLTLYRSAGQDRPAEPRPGSGDEVDLKALEAELDQVRREYCAFNISEDICAVGAPIWDHTDHVIGGLSMSAPADRFQRRAGHYASAVKAASEWASDRLGASSNAQSRWARLRRDAEAA